MASPALCAHRGLLDICRKALERIDARVLRLMFARAPWELPMSYTAGETETEARSIDNVFKRFFARAQAILAKFPLATRPPATEWLVSCACPLLDALVTWHAPL